MKKICKKTTTHSIRKQLGNITQKQFAEGLEIPLRTVTNWDQRSTFPVWLEKLILKAYKDEVGNDCLWKSPDNKQEY